METQLLELIETAEQEAEESKEHMNSYGHGYDVGYLQGLRDVLLLLASEHETE